MKQQPRTLDEIKKEHEDGLEIMSNCEYCRAIGDVREMLKRRIEELEKEYNGYMKNGLYGYADDPHIMLKELKRIIGEGK